MIDQFGMNIGNQGMGMPSQGMPGQPNPMDRSSSFFSASPDDDLIKWQLEVEKMKERIEHILRGDKLAYDQTKKVMIWTTNKDPQYQIMNDLGIQKVLNFLDFYLNRNTILSYYGTDEEINDKMFDLGWDFADDLYFTYEKYGFDTEEKRKHYILLCREVTDMIHSAYKRALQGRELDSLRTARMVNQNTGMSPMMGMGGMGMGMPMNIGVEEEKFSMNPFKLFKRR